MGTRISKAHMKVAENQQLEIWWKNSEGEEASEDVHNKKVRKDDMSGHHVSIN